ncbi:CLUMA_CG002793, isoform A [Clunio marinus]|uniref:CLUMA_CG002793, isoform A n=1 Tax=Clunio marinus TaxID=568069 RepID=A0A1J1HRF1_9DIPT|nr:CLUMA_CG002793, isoform A [Clunio marinus]
MFCYHPTFKFIQLHKNLSDTIEDGSDLYRLKTEDGFEIRKLYLKLLNKTIGSDELKFLLSVYGEIESMKFFRKKGKIKNRGFVTFKDASSASCALINRKQFSRLFMLLPGDTWTQPDYERTQKTEEENGKSEIEALEIFEILNDDCLLHVMKFLDILEVLSLKRVCEKFAELCEIHLKSIKQLNFTNIHGRKKLTLHEGKLVLESVGKNISSLSISSDKFYNQRILNFIPKYLKSLKHLHLTGFKLDCPSFWDQISVLLPSLETLDLSDNSEIDENFLKSFKNSKPSLKFLNVTNCNVNGSFLPLVTFVESINVSGCRHINGKQLLIFVEENKSLKSLIISKCPNIFGRDVNEVLQNVPHLEFLSLNNYYIDEETSRLVIPNINTIRNLKHILIQNINFPPCDQLLRTINLDNCIESLNISYGNLTLTTIYAISTMKHLKKLVMNFKNSVPEDLVDYLMKLDKLEEIHMSCCSYISPANVLRLLLLPNLKFLDISRCYGFSNEFVFEAFKILKENQPRNLFIMNVGQTEIDQSINKTPELNGSQNILQLSWKTMKDLEHDYDIDEENNKLENVNHQEYFSIDDIINILSNIDECDPSLVEIIKRNL